MKIIRKITSFIFLLLAFEFCFGEAVVMNETPYARIENVLAKIKRGEDVTVAVMGGSITTGYNASPINVNSLASIVGEWFYEKADQSDCALEFLNRGVSGTDSAYGAVRVYDHLIRNNVDLVILEYAMNDQWLEAKVRKRSYEGIIRQIEEDSERAVLALFVNERFSPQRSNQAEEKEICDYYNIPYVSWKDCADEEYGGNPDWDSWFEGNEGVHPDNRGHAKIAEYIITKLEEIWNGTDAEKINPVSKELPPVLSDLTYQNFDYYTSKNLEPVSNTGWTNSSPVHNEWVSHGFAKRGWQTDVDEAEIVFKIHASSINILYCESDQFRNCSAWIEKADGTAGKKFALTCFSSGRKGYLGWSSKEIFNGEEGDYLVHIKCPKPRSKKDEGRKTNVCGIIAGHRE